MHCARSRLIRATRDHARNYASHANVKTPFALNLKPPPPPTPAPRSPPSSPSSSPSSSSQASTSSSSSTLPKPRLDYARLLSSPEQTALNAARRAVRLPPDHLAHLSRLRETQLLLLQKLSTIRAKQREVGELIRTGLGEAEESKRQAKKLKARVKEYEAALVETESELLDLALVLPNFSHPSSPVGSEENAITLETFGPATHGVAAENERDHVTIASYFDWIDTDASSVATGSSWPYLKGTLALLEQALVQYALSVAIQHGFTPVVPPDVIKTDIAWRCGFQPRDSASNPSSQTYHIQSPESQSQSATQLCLAGTSEIPLAGLFADKLLTEESLPRKVVGVGKAFRAEAGARGADTRGLYRVHQFTKVELFAVTKEDGSEALMEEIREVQREIAQGLGLSVRVLDMPTEELGASASRKYDMEAWMPGRGKWGEITSTSNCTDYQSRRLNITYRPTASPPAPGTDVERRTGGLPFVHTLNGTAAAVPRLIVTLVENGIKYRHRVEAEGKAEGGKGGKVEYLGLELPKVLERFWVGGQSLSEGKEGRIWWV